MAEIGWVQWAELTLQVSEQVLPRYRSKFSKHQFTQPQLLAILCLMRYEDWTYRETEVRLVEPSDLRRVLQAVVKHMPGKRQRRTGAVDATGLAEGAKPQRFHSPHARSHRSASIVAALVEMAFYGGHPTAIHLGPRCASRPLE